MDVRKDVDICRIRFGFYEMLDLNALYVRMSR